MKRWSLLSALLVVLVAAGFTLPRDAAPVARPEATPVSWQLDKSHSNIGFKVRHLGISTVRGSFGSYDAQLTFDPEDLTTLRATATIDVASIDTQNERRDNHLRSDDFFNAEQYPQMKFVSKRVQNVKGNTFQIVGDLTIRDVTKEVVLEAEMTGTTTMRGKRRVGFEAQTTVDRFDYNLKWGALTEAGGLVAGRDVTIVLELEAIEA